MYNQGPLYSTFCMHTHINICVYSVGPALLCTQYYSFTGTHQNSQCGMRSWPPISNDKISSWLLYLSLFYMATISIISYHIYFVNCCNSGNANCMLNWSEINDIIIIINILLLSVFCIKINSKYVLYCTSIWKLWASVLLYTARWKHFMLERSGEMKRGMGKKSLETFLLPDRSI